MFEQNTPCVNGTLVPLSCETAVRETKAALAAAGFDVVAEIDMQSLLWRHGGKRIGPYMILGVCHPALAYRALKADPDAGPLVPSNVAVFAAEEPGWSVVATVDPEASLGDIGQEIGTRLTDAVTRVAAYEPPTAPWFTLETIAETDEIC